MAAIHIQITHSCIVPYVGAFAFYNGNIVEVVNVEQFHFLYSSLAMLADNLMPLIMAELRPWCSISFKPAMVQPLGEVTLSISSSGCERFCSSNCAAPNAVCAAIVMASCA